MLIPPAEKIPAIIANAREGLPIRIVARLSRLRPDYLAALLAEGDTDGAPVDVVEFTRDYREAEAQFVREQHRAVATSTARITSDTDPNVGARLALLERTVPEYQRGGVVVAEGPPKASDVPGKVAELDKETRRKLKAALESAPQVADTRLADVHPHKRL